MYVGYSKKNLPFINYLLHICTLCASFLFSFGLPVQDHDGEDGKCAFCHWDWCMPHAHCSFLSHLNRLCGHFVAERRKEQLVKSYITNIRTIFAVRFFQMQMLVKCRKMILRGHF